ncbi:hypothetical protein B296_00055835 [Ensete ventricosum]|uniref:Uncharacterized protein n=1 Tax=Ensete ventricosum TaxID=4639 RepID=A0A426XXK7_ENSVE|nr:hypothetical protein B296_00055835 [Ensete ventricosum]
MQRSMGEKTKWGARRRREATTTWEQIGMVGSREAETNRKETVDFFGRLGFRSCQLPVLQTWLAGVLGCREGNQRWRRWERARQEEKRRDRERGMTEEMESCCPPNNKSVPAPIAGVVSMPCRLLLVTVKPPRAEESGPSDRIGGGRGWIMEGLGVA